MILLILLMSDFKLWISSPQKFMFDGVKLHWGNIFVFNVNKIIDLPGNDSNWFMAKVIKNITFFTQNKSPNADINEEGEISSENFLL